MTLVRITAENGILYSLDNGITQTEYESGGVFQVPDWVGANMIKRGWAKEVKAEDLDKAEPESTEPPVVDISELRRSETKKESKP